MNRAEFRRLYRAVRIARAHNLSRSIGIFCGYSLAQASQKMRVEIPAELADYDFSSRPHRPMIRDERAAERRRIAQRLADARACYHSALDARAFAIANGFISVPPAPVHPEALKEKLFAEYRNTYLRQTA